MGSIRRKNLALKIAWHVLLVILCIGMVFPFYWMAVSALKTQAEINLFPPTFWPESPLWSNFLETWQAAPFDRYIFNSFYTATAIVAIQIFNTALIAYALTQLKFKSRALLFGVILATYMLPVAVTYLPSYIILARLGWIDTYRGIILSNSASVFAIFLVRQAFMQVPHELVEAAKVDGASHWRILWGIFFPLTRPVFITFALINFVISYNNYLWPLLIIRSRDMRLITIGLRQFFIEHGAYGINWSLIMAASTIAVLPLLIIFFLTQKWFVKGVGDTGIKG